MKKTVIITCLCGVLVITFNLKCKNRIEVNDPRGSLYAGSATCTNCHTDIYKSYLHTAHYLASLPANNNTVLASFAKHSNVFNLNDSQKIVMEKSGDAMFQTYYLNGKVKQRYRFDIVFGGVKGASYLYWKGNELYQLPLSSYGQQHIWSTSPGYGFNFLDYSRSRSIGKRCFECHASYINDLPGTSAGLSTGEKLDKNTIVYSIDCERCHGPGKRHVDFQTQHPDIKTARFITTYSSLNRIQKISMCAVCHSGISTSMLRSTFEFLPGDTFAKFKMPDFYETIDTNHLDVHGKQVQLLQSSQCFINSQMDCATCHDTHQNSRGDKALYSAKCLNCHNSPGHVYCRMSNKIKTSALNANCIGCHMPALPSKSISVQVADKSSVQFFVHTHHIATYPQEVKKILAYINQ
jgi:hypothetical protein